MQSLLPLKLAPAPLGGKGGDWGYKGLSREEPDRQAHLSIHWAACKKACYIVGMPVALDLEQQLEEFEEDFQELWRTDANEAPVSQVNLILYSWAQSIAEHLSVESPRGWTLLPLMCILPKVSQIHHKAFFYK